MLLPGEVVELVLIAGEEPPVRLKMKETETKIISPGTSLSFWRYALKKEHSFMS